MGDVYQDDGARGPEDSDEEDEYYENPVELIKEFGTHPLMERAQKALTAQLKATQYKDLFVVLPLLQMRFSGILKLVL